MQEVKVSKLDKEDKALLADLKKEGKKIELLIAQTNSKHTALWQHLKLKYNLAFGEHHYIVDNIIYKQETQ